MMRLHIDGIALLAGERTLIASLTQHIDPGEVWCIAGPNGAGKTTLINVLAGLSNPAMGHIKLDGRPLDAWPASGLAKARALMPQASHDAFGSSVLDTVLLNRFPHLTGWGWESADDRAAALEALERLGLSSLKTRDVMTLSGGERQRVALAAVLCQNTPLLLLDEPLAHLDLHHQIDCLHVLAGEARDQQHTVIFSCHDLNLARRFSTHALLLDGKGGAVAGHVADVLTPERASAAFGCPLALICDGAHEALVPLIPNR
ncbi:Iron(III) dicitrate transport ATP-binding protein fecE [Candidatus Burkholderia pumila]|uniref:Iron(III) dicitrate transport ATP-binding protein fecE n=1 Tax=Candidatus Burkholderia pumila TaxID=1090375 RepID=A0ABR5HMP3_9BURK|nr:Iron(III) dicitrate transport ATP-binding protein fecE [Candidatus Burkholderia pumila]